VCHSTGIISGFLRLDHVIQFYMTTLLLNAPT
jgi:hypothetical protein